MSPGDQTFLRDFFRQLIDQALEPDDARYVPLYQTKGVTSEDPVELIARGVEWTPRQSVQLLSGFRGTGKSTELRRLRRRLQNAGYLVVLFDIEDYVNLSTPVDVSDFLMAITGAFSDALAAPELLGASPALEGYWDRFVHFLKATKVEVNEIGLDVEGGVDPVKLKSAIKLSLKTDPSFKAALQKRMAGHLGSLVLHVQRFVSDAVRELKHLHGVGKECVVLVDSMEHIRGTSSNTDEVHHSVETLFAGHADKLALPGLHVVYTVPPYLKVRYANLGSLYAPGGIHVLPAVKLCEDRTGNRCDAGFEAIERVVAARGDWTRLLGTREALDELIAKSGGHIRDLLRLLAEVTRRAATLPVDAATVDKSIDQLRNEYFPIAEQDAVWLTRIAETHQAALEEASRLPDLARFLDTHMVLCYRNGHEWYDTHPLIKDEVRRQAAQVANRAAARAPTA